MSARLEALALERELLVARSALCRLRLRRGSQVLRDSLSWQGLAVAAAATPPARRLAFDLALSFVGVRRAARAIVLASRALSLARADRRLPVRASRCGTSTLIRLSFAIGLEYEIAGQPADSSSTSMVPHAVAGGRLREPRHRSAARARVCMPTPSTGTATCACAPGRAAGHALRSHRRPRAPPRVARAAAEVPIASRPRRRSPSSIQPLLPVGPPARFRRARVRPPSPGTRPGAGDPRLGMHTDGLPPGELEQQHLGPGHAGGADGGLPGFRPPDDRAVPRAQHSGALRDQHRLRSGRRAGPPGFPCLRRGVPRRPLVFVRSHGDHVPDAARAHRHGP